jgi:hypothetical protein
MAYVPGFEHDVFISYARENNVPDLNDVKWVTDFFVNLQRYLLGRIRGADVYFDTRDFEAGHELGDLIEHARNSALFVVILSPRYIEPDKFTLKELKAFREASSPRGPIVVIEPWKTDRDDLPKELQGPKANPFFVVDETTNTEETLTLKYNKECYAKEFNKIAEHIKNRLNEMQAQARLVGNDAVPPGQAQKTVLMAKCTDDLVYESDEVRSYLEQFGIKVLPGGDYPETVPDFVSRYKADLARADLVVQLLSSSRSPLINGEGESSYAKFQYDAAKAAGRQVLQWQHPGIEGKLAKVQHYDVPFLRTSPDIQRMLLEEFKREIKKTLERPAASQPQRSRLPNVFIAADQLDHDRAMKLREKFKNEHCSASVLANELKQKSSEAIRKDFHDKASMANAVVFLYGDAPVAFVDRCMTEYIKHHLGEQERVEAIYHAPPPPGMELDSDWHGLLTVGSRTDFTLDDVAKIVAELRRAAR